MSISGACLGEFEADRALAEDRFVLIERVYWHRAGLLRPALAGGERVRIAVALDREVGAVVADALHLGRRGDARHEYLGRLAELHRRIGDRRAMVAARRRDHSGLRYLAGQQIREGAARLERPRVLQELELERQRMAGQAELGAVDLDDRRAPDVGPNESLHCAIVSEVAASSRGIARPPRQVDMN